MIKVEGCIKSTEILHVFGPQNIWGKTEDLPLLRTGGLIKQRFESGGVQMSLIKFRLSGYLRNACHFDQI